MGTDPPYIPAKFGDDTLKPSKVMDEKLQKFDAWKNNNNNRKLDNQISLLSNKDIPKPDEN